MAETNPSATNGGKDPKPKTAKDFAAYFKSSTVRIPKLGKDNKLVIEKGIIQTQERQVTAADIISVREYEDRVVAVTVDGQKLEAAL